MINKHCFFQQKVTSLTTITSGLSSQNTRESPREIFTTIGHFENMYLAFVDFGQTKKKTPARTDFILLSLMINRYIFLYGLKPVGMNGSNFKNETLFVSFTAIITTRNR